MKDFKRVIEILLLWITITVVYFIQGIKNRRFFSHIKIYLKEFFLHLEIFSKHIHEHKDLEDLQSSKYNRLQQTAAGLHQLLTQKKVFSYSILFVAKGSANVLKHTLESLVNLTAPNFEILVGLKETDHDVKYLLATFEQKYPNKIKISNFDVDVSETSIVNSLASVATGNYFLIVESGDWLRPDFLYRYEQTLNFYGDSEYIVLFCDEYQVDDSFTPIPRTRTNKPEIIPFPYVFTDDFGKSLLIPKKMWNKIRGLREGNEGLHLFDLPLRLHYDGAIFHKVPVHLYARLHKNKSQQLHDYGLLENNERILSIFSRYTTASDLKWHWEKGYSNNSFRALPTLDNIPKVHVVMLYKDQRNLTLSAVKHVQEQTGVHIFVTAVDNNSKDLSIGKHLEELGVEVIRIEEPFNFSRLNNLGVQQSKVGKYCDHILFLNNDVDLEKDAVLEMCRWINQPGIGMVGCRLNYPNGTLQHGGVIIEDSRAAFIKSWHHVERTEKFGRLEKTHFLRVTAAVTAACCLINRSTFLEVEGFDEIWFPIAFSDTALAVKVKAKGLHCFYTPFSVGIHHESVSRKKINIEDYESLTWAHRKFVQNLWKNKKINFEELKNVEY